MKKTGIINSIGSYLGLWKGCLTTIVVLRLEKFGPTFEGSAEEIPMLVLLKKGDEVDLEVRKVVNKLRSKKRCLTTLIEEVCVIKRPRLRCGG